MSTIIFRNPTTKEQLSEHYDLLERGQNWLKHAETPEEESDAHTMIAEAEWHITELEAAPDEISL